MVSNTRRRLDRPLGPLLIAPERISKVNPSTAVSVHTTTEASVKVPHSPPDKRTARHLFTGRSRTLATRLIHPTITHATMSVEWPNRRTRLCDNQANTVHRFGAGTKPPSGPLTLLCSGRGKKQQQRRLTRTGG